jgi:hypothetical protein
MEIQYKIIMSHIGNLQDLATTVHNNPIPPRPRSHFGADSPRRGEYGSLWRASGREHKQQ